MLQVVAGFENVLSLNGSSNSPTPTLVPMPVFKFLVHFLQHLLTFGTFWIAGEHCDVTGGTWF